MIRKPLLLAVLVLLCASAARAGDIPSAGESKPTKLGFWSIGISEFYAEEPQPINVPYAGDMVRYYWYWSFKFRVETNLEKLKKYIEERLPKIDDDTERLALEFYVKRIEKTLADANYADMYANIYTDTGQILADTSNRMVRNLIENEEHMRLHTISEIKTLDLHKIKETKDPDHGYGKWVYGVAIFRDLDPECREFEIRLVNNGERVVPNYEPGEFIYPVASLNKDEALEPSLRRALRFFYHRVGHSGEAYLDPIQDRGRRADWVWLWAPQVLLGKYRILEIDRPTDLGLKRRYRYVPYRVWNNTNQDQFLDVRKAGLVFDIDWHGQNVDLTMYDMGEADDFWKTMVVRRIKQRVADGKETEFVRANETYRTELTHDQIKAHYKELGIAYIPSFQTDPSKIFQTQESRDDEAKHGRELVDAMEANPSLKKTQEEQQEKALQDVERKADILPPKFGTPGGNRHVKGKIPPQTMVKGLIILRWGVNDLEATIDEIIAALRTQAISGRDPEKNELLKRYLAMRKPNPYPGLIYTAPPEPAREEVIEMLLAVAKDDIEAKGLKVTSDDERRYKELAPVAVAINAAADEWAQKQAEKGFTNAFFEVETGGVIDRGTTTGMFVTMLPETREPTPRMTEGIGPVDMGSLGPGVGPTPTTPGPDVGIDEGADEKEEEKEKGDTLEGFDW